MIPWLHIDTTRIPGGGEMHLMQRGAEFSIRLDGNELMSSRLSATEQALATIACDRIKLREAPRILIGGYGMGFTLRAALKVLGPHAEIVVAELVPAVIAWARGPMADLSGNSLSDPRVRIHEGDVGALIRKGRAAYDAILLDVDNGPEGMTRVENDRLYDVKGLRAAYTALRPGGVLGVWSSAPHTKFTERLRQTGYSTDEIPLRAKGPRGGARHLIWMAMRD
jgi:spermidine synthase